MTSWTFAERGGNIEQQGTPLEMKKYNINAK